MVYVTAVRGTEDGCGNALGAEFVVGPLALLRIVPDKGDGHVVLVEDRDPPMQLRDDGVVSVKTDLARTAHVLRDVADEFAVKVKVAEAEIFPIADQEQRLIVTRVDSQSMTAIALSVLGALAREA